MLEPSKATKQHRRHRGRLIKGLQASTELVQLVAPSNYRRSIVGRHDRSFQLSVERALRRVLLSN